MELSNALIIVSVLLLVEFTQANELVQAHGGVGRSLLQTETIDCRSKCKERCSASSRLNVCLRACGTCCMRCHSVPPGTSGNCDACPCYGNIKTHGGRRKCP